MSTGTRIFIFIICIIVAAFIIEFNSNTTVDNLFKNNDTVLSAEFKKNRSLALGTLPCARNSTMTDELGTGFGCYGVDDNPKLWINADNNGGNSIKLSILTPKYRAPNESEMDWAVRSLNAFASKRSYSIIEALKAGQEMREVAGDVRIETRYHSGPGLDERLLIITPR